MDILQALVAIHPEALVVRDKQSKGGRTPSEILRRYYPPTDTPAAALSRLEFIERATIQWPRHWLRSSVRLCANRYFAAKDDSGPVPFDEDDRRGAKIRPRAWFVLSVFGYLRQREMKILADNILSFLGRCAGTLESGPGRQQKRKRKTLPSA